MKKFLILVLVVIMLSSLSGCIEVIEGVPQEEYDELKAAYDEVVAKLDKLLRDEQAKNANTPETTALEETGKQHEINAPIEADKEPEVEILFRGIPWGTSSSEAKNIIESDGNTYTFILKDTTIDTVDHLLDIDYYSRLPNAGNILHGYNLSVAGYDVSQISLNFMYKVDGGKVDKSDDELYSAVYALDTTDHETVYLTLKQKLADLYGEGNEVESSKKGWIFAQDYSGDYKYRILETTWYGTNNTFVTLRWTSNTNEATSVQAECGIKIAYGKSDANEKLKILRDALEQEQKAEDRDKSESNNNEGL